MHTRAAFHCRQVCARPGNEVLLRYRDFEKDRAIYRQPGISTKWPPIAAAAAMAGETRCVRPLKPWRPSKLRLDVEAQRSCGFSLSGVIARHMEQSGSRPSQTAAL